MTRLLIGSQGDDTLEIAGERFGVLPEDADTLRGLGGDDLIAVSGPGRFVLEGGDGDDRLVAQFSYSGGTFGDPDEYGGQATLRGGAGNDTLDVSAVSSDSGGTDFAAAVLAGGAGDDLFVLPQTPAVIVIEDLEPGEAVRVGGASADEPRVEVTPGGVWLNRSDWFWDGFDDYRPAAGVFVMGVSDLVSALVPGTSVYGPGTIAFVPGDTVLDRQGADGRLFVGAADSDVVRAAAGADTLLGAAGDDTLSGGAGDDALSGGRGADSLSGDDGDDVVAGQAGADRLFGGAGNDGLYGGAGADALSGGDGADSLYGGAGADTMTGGSGLDTLYGGEGADQIAVGNGDVAGGGEGNDTLIGTGTASMYGGDGDDVVSGGGRLEGNVGDDTLTGGAGADWLVGDTNSFRTGLGDTSVPPPSGAGADLLFGGGGNDTLDGGEGADSLNGGDGDDLLNGGTAFEGYSGDAYRSADDARDVLDGGAGNDTLILGLGDVGIGGAGIDSYRLSITAGVAASIHIAALEAGEAIYLGEADGEVGDGWRGGTLTENRFSGLLSAEVSFGVVEGTPLVLAVRGASVTFASGLERTFFGESVFAYDAVGRLLFVPAAAASEGRDFLASPGDVAAGGGDDVVRGTETGERIEGGAGLDLLIARGGDDAVFGGEGGDHLDGGPGRDTVFGGSGDDVALGGEGADAVDGGVGDDILVGEGGADTLTGGLGGDIVQGGAGADVIYGDGAPT